VEHVKQIAINALIAQPVQNAVLPTIYIMLIAIQYALMEHINVMLIILVKIVQLNVPLAVIKTLAYLVKQDSP
jgi:hypothetical protein